LPWHCVRRSAVDARIAKATASAMSWPLLHACAMRAKPAIESTGIDRVVADQPWVLRAARIALIRSSGIGGGASLLDLSHKHDLAARMVCR